MKKTNLKLNVASLIITLMLVACAESPTKEDVDSTQTVQPQRSYEPGYMKR